MRTAILSVILLLTLSPMAVLADWDVTYDGDKLPDECGWTKSGDGNIEVQNGVLYLDTLPDQGANFSQEWNVTSEDGVVVAARLKVVDNNNEDWRNGLCLLLQFTDANTLDLYDVFTRLYSFWWVG